MRTKSSKAFRRINCLDIQEQLNAYLNDNRDCDDHFTESNETIVATVVKERDTYSLHDFIKACSYTNHTKKKRYKVPKTSKQENVAKIHEDKRNKDSIERVCNNNNYVNEEYRYYMLDFQSKSPSLHFSRLGQNLRGSIKILCSDFKVAFLLIWSVSEITYDIHLVPIINCSTLDNDSIHTICENTSQNLHLLFQDHLKTKGKSYLPNKENIFHELNCFFTNNETEFSINLSKKLQSFFDSDKNLSTPLENILKGFTNIQIDHSMDYFDIFASSNIDCGDIVEAYIHDGKSKDENYCSICFDLFKDDDVQLRTCCHKFCDSCWKGYVRASSTSGDAVVRCPGFKCDEVLNVRDMAHLLFDTTKKVMIQDMLVLMSLMKFKMNYILLDRKVNHCSMPSCNRIFLLDTSSSNGGNKDKRTCSRVCLCKCGASRCSYCGEPSHFGLSCMASKQIRKEVENGRMDNELRSLIWLQRNCTPCPRCRLPINKNGGCNHVRCGKCQYYFCWVCGGDGLKCGAYLCRNTGTTTFGKEETESYLSGKSMIASQVFSLKKYSDAMINLEDCFKRIAIDSYETDSLAKYELRLRKILTWLRGSALEKSQSFSSRNRKYQSRIGDIATSVELVLGFLTKSFGTNEIREVLEDKENMINPVRGDNKSEKKNITKRSRNESNHQHELDENMTSLNSILEVSNILAMNEKQFHAHMSTLLNEAMKQLVNNGRKRKKFVDKNQTYRTIPLNKKKKPLKAPWRGESRFDTPEIIVQDVNRKIKDKEKIRWKGKSKVNVRRNFALNSNEIEI